MSSKKLTTKLWVKIILVIFIFLSFNIGYMVFFPRKIPDNYQLVIDKNETIFAISEDLSKHNIIKGKLLFRMVLRLLGKDRNVVAGLYFLKNSVSIWSLVSRLTNGKPDQISITLLDGWSFFQIKNYIDELQNIQHLTINYSEEELKSALRIHWPSLEGVFYPSTYFVAPNQTDLEIYQQAYRLMQNKLLAYFNARTVDNTQYMNPYQLLIMASLIQKETNDKNDMFLVSTVFNNRLRKGMKLQNDPAVFYGLRHQKSVTRKDFQIDTPYNTYIKIGLPPTPICTPSDNAMLAASSPLNKPDLLFFVAIGSGKTKFSNTFTEHKSAVKRYLKK